MNGVVLFDMNGIIVDDEDIHLAAFRLLAQEDGRGLSDEEYREFFAGRTDREGLERFFSSQGVDIAGTVNVLLERKSELYQEAARDGLVAIDGALEAVYSTRGLPRRLALVTSSTSLEARTVLQTLGIGGAFEIVVTADDITTGKPAPDPYLLGAQLMGVDPSTCVVVEDSPSGVLSAKAAGCLCIGVTTTHTTADLAEADLVVRTMSEVPAAVERVSS